LVIFNRLKTLLSMLKPNSFIFLAIFLAYCAQAQTRKITLDDMDNQVGISNLQINPQGTHAILMTSKRNLDKNNYLRSLILLDISKKTQKAIADTLKGISAPVWMTDGKRISFIANTTSGRQVLIFDPWTGHASAVTNSTTDVVRFSWNHKNDRLAYFAEEPPENLQSNTFNDSFEVGSNDYRVEETPSNTAVWIQDQNDGSNKQITPRGFTVATGLSTSALSWSNDDALLVFTKFPSAFSGDSDLGVNYLYDLKSGKLTAINEDKKGASGPSFSTDNQFIYNYPRDGVASNMDDWYMMDLKSKEIVDLTRELDRTVYSIHWLRKGQALLAGVDYEGSAIWKLENGGFTKIALGGITGVSGFDVASNGSMIIAGSSPEMPDEVYYKANVSALPIKLTDFNKWVEQRVIGRQEVMEWRSSDGLHPNGVITYPPDFESTGKYPLLLVIHGGPTASSSPDFSLTIQTMAAKGWIIFQPNYRGSNNLGNAFQTAISKDPSEGPGHDVITGVEMLKEKPYIDSGRIAVSGWSYGGWMTSWLIGRYPDQWIAAVAGAAPVDFTDMYSLNDLNRMRRHAIVESPYVGNNLMWAYKNSPIYNFSKIKAPTLIMSKTADTRVTVTGSYKLYGALRDNNVPVQFIAYPGGGHFPADPVRSQDVWQRWINWIEKYFDQKIDDVKIEKK